jgi:Flp pilus assembly protein TadG
MHWLSNATLQSTDENAMKTFSNSSPTRTALATLRMGTSGQAMLEFAMIASLLCAIVFGGLQSAVLFNAYLAVEDLVYQGARYAAVNPGYTTAQVSTFMTSVASPVISDNNGANITVSVSPDTTPRAFGQPISVTVSYSLANKLMLPNPFLGVSFPSTLSFTETAMSE